MNDTTIVDGAESPEETNADFMAGFTSESSTETPKTEAKGQGQASTEQVADEVTERAAAEQPAAEAQPEYVQITRQDWENHQKSLGEIMARAAAIDNIVATQNNLRDQTAGKFGGIERTLKELQTPVDINIDPESLTNVREDFPELAPAMAKDMSAIIKQMKVIPVPVPRPDAISAEQINQTVQSLASEIASKAVSERLTKDAEEFLDEESPGWRELRDNPGFGEWLQTQPQDYQIRVSNSENPHFALKVINSYKEFEKSKKQRKNDLKEAVVPKGAGGNAAPDITQTEFEKGFAQDYRGR